METLVALKWLFVLSVSYLPTPLPTSPSMASQMRLEEANNQDGKCVEMQKSLKSQLPAGSVLPGGDREILESDCKPSEYGD